MLLIFCCGFGGVEIEGETASGGGQTTMLLGRKKIVEWCTARGVAGRSNKGEESG
jgi:hypothetical protein